MSNSSSATESSSQTGKKFWQFDRNGNLGIGLLWPSDLKLPFPQKRYKNVDVDNVPDVVYLTLKEAAARGRTSSMSSDLGVSGSRRKSQRRGRPRRRCTSEPPQMSKYSPKPTVGFSGAVDSVVGRQNPRTGRSQRKSTNFVDQTRKKSDNFVDRSLSDFTRTKVVSNSESRLSGFSLLFGICMTIQFLEDGSLFRFKAFKFLFSEITKLILIEYFQIFKIFKIFKMDFFRYFWIIFIVKNLLFQILCHFLSWLLFLGGYCFCLIFYLW